MDSSPPADGTPGPSARDMRGEIAHRAPTGRRAHVLLAADLFDGCAEYRRFAADLARRAGDASRVRLEAVVVDSRALSDRVNAGDLEMGEGGLEALCPAMPEGVRVTVLDKALIETDFGAFVAAVREAGERLRTEGLSGDETR